jgi:tetratricopeptide (TPR) repeat protein
MRVPALFARLLLVGLSSAIWASSAVEAEPLAPPSAANTVAAREHFEHGHVMFDAGRYLDALHEFEAGYRLAPLPLFLYNMGQACRHAGLAARAIENYERYLEAVPDAPEREEVEKYLRELRAATSPSPSPSLQVSVVTPVESVSRPLTATAPSTPTPRSHRWFWYGGALAAVVAGTATAIVLSSGHGAPHTDLGNLQVHPP